MWSDLIKIKILLVVVVHGVVVVVVVVAWKKIKIKRLKIEGS